MRRKTAIKAEAVTDEYVPYRHHVANDVVRTDDRSLLAVFRVGGRHAETADPIDVDAWHNRLNVLMRNIASDRLILSVHLLRRAASQDDYPAGTFRSDFAKRLDEAYRNSVLQQLYRNDLFLSVLRLPPAVAGDRITQWWSRRRKLQSETPTEARQHLEEVSAFYRLISHHTV